MKTDAPATAPKMPPTMPVPLPKTAPRASAEFVFVKPAISKPTIVANSTSLWNRLECC